MSQTGKAFSLLETALADVGAVCTPAELHGYLTAGLCVKTGGDTRRAVDALLEAYGVEANEGFITTLNALRELARKQLEDVNMSFMLMLPEDEAGLTARAQALAHWAEAFLAGFGMQGGTITDESFFEDLSQIAQLDTSTEFSEEDEQELIEICEYVRLGIISLYIDARPKKVQ